MIDIPDKRILDRMIYTRKLNLLFYEKYIEAMGNCTIESVLFFIYNRENKYEVSKITFFGN